MSENIEIRDQAFVDYKRGMKYKEIAEKYGVSLSAVKSWASRYWKKESCNPKEKKLQAKKKKVATRGAPEGNQNAVGNKGGAAPVGNKNAVTTGEFETLLFDCLDPEEKKLAAAVPDDKEQLLLQEIQLLTVRERRMLKRIEDLKTKDFTLVKKKKGIEKDKQTDLDEEHAVLGQIQSIEDALTRVQAQKQRAIDSLHRYGFDDARLELEVVKVELASMRIGGQETETEDDGFIAALNVETGSLWEDTDES